VRQCAVGYHAAPFVAVSSVSARRKMGPGTTLSTRRTRRAPRPRRVLPHRRPILRPEAVLEDLPRHQNTPPSRNRLLLFNYFDYQQLKAYSTGTLVRYRKFRTLDEWIESGFHFQMPLKDPEQIRTTSSIQKCNKNIS
jgi:hypothetical protein